MSVSWVPDIVISFRKRIGLVRHSSMASIGGGNRIDDERIHKRCFDNHRPADPNPLGSLFGRRRNPLPVFESPFEPPWPDQAREARRIFNAIG